MAQDSLMNKKLFILPILALYVTSCGVTSAPSVDPTVDPTSTPTTTEPEVEYVSEYYSNVLIPRYTNGKAYNNEIADPSIVKGDDGRYYVFSTIRKLFSTKDFKTWRVESERIIDRPTWADGERHGNPDVWAPDAIKIKGKWIYYYSVAAWDMPSAGIGYAVADDIAGPYVDKGLLFNEDMMDINGLIDPQPFIDDDGKVYMIVGSFHGNYVVELEDDGMSLKDGYEHQRDTKSLIAGIDIEHFDNTYYEGCYIVKKDDYYYMFGSAGSCCAGSSSTYKVVVGRSKNIRGPYVDSKGKDLAQNNNGSTIGDIVLWSSPSSKTAGPGHNSVFVDDAGDYWMIYHAYCDYDNYATRHLFMDKIYWQDNGFPIVGYEYENDDGEIVFSKMRPSYNIELEGPRFIEKEE